MPPARQGIQGLQFLEKAVLGRCEGLRRDVRAFPGGQLDEEIVLDFDIGKSDSALVRLVGLREQLGDVLFEVYPRGEEGENQCGADHQRIHQRLVALEETVYGNEYLRGAFHGYSL